MADIRVPVGLNLPVCAGRLDLLVVEVTSRPVVPRFRPKKMCSGVKKVLQNHQPI